MSQAYSPDHRNVLPSTRCTPSASIWRDFQKSNSATGKSFPTMPTSFTGEKKLAPKAAYDAEPPNKSACSSTGVLTVSSAMEPTIRTDIKQRSEVGGQRAEVSIFFAERAYDAMS